MERLQALLSIAYIVTHPSHGVRHRCVGTVDAAHEGISCLPVTKRWSGVGYQPLKVA